MINRYRRAAREVAELGPGELEPLSAAIPELQVGPQVGPLGTGSRAGPEPNPSESGEIVQVAQSVEQWTENPRVDSSILSLDTTKSADSWLSR
jgi:hypothetical protein